jgi:hypothetical protein
VPRERQHRQLEGIRLGDKKYKGVADHI